jgi:hypothetical protein
MIITLEVINEATQQDMVATFISLTEFTLYVPLQENLLSQRAIDIHRVSIHHCQSIPLSSSRRNRSSDSLQILR